MYTILAPLAAFIGFVAAQDTTFAAKTGVRSLWIPFQTISGTPVASIASSDPTRNITKYVIACPTASPQCSIAPNLTLTEGIGYARYIMTNSAGAATINCEYTGTETATCSQNIIGSDSNILATSTTISGSAINFQAVQVTATQNITSTSAGATSSKTSSMTSSTSSSSAGGAGQTPAAAPWALGGVLGAGLMAVVAL
ncbi:hypothetical protein LTR62_003249 [Meristemomyces frigidus]|uniref:GPI anchored protein n=1 Tax=Meristemomyces frigidus TaxID=1508187 RepID=A0AAN7TKW3_9PEZI|nr:hypothetical protein LTR62_003249 [Meristemomyces frigidus]